MSTLHQPQVDVTKRTLGFNGLEIDGVDLGGTDGEVTITKTTTWYERKCNEVMGKMGKVPIDCTVTLSFTLTEATLENLRRVWNEKAALSETAEAKALFIGVPSNTFHTITLYGINHYGKDRKYIFYNCCNAGGGSHSLKRDSDTFFPMEWEVYGDPTKDLTKRFGTIIDYKQ